MNTHEILTLQFGHYSNFVGTHWWNLQESSFQYDPTKKTEINHDILYREGLTLKGETTFTPRLLLVDLKGSLKVLPEKGDLYQNPKPSKSNEESIEVIREDPHPKNSFLQDIEAGNVDYTRKIYDLDNEVKVWSDFLYARFHPRTVNIVKEYQHGSEDSPFDLHPLGSQLWKTEAFQEDFADKIRNYIEECDHFQGFHTLLDSTTAFGGLASACIEFLRDEYDTKSTLAFPITPYIKSSEKNPALLLNLALCFDSLSQHASLLAPLSMQTKGVENRHFQHLEYKPELNYHTSAILATALDTLTLTYRQKSTHHSLLDLVMFLGSEGRKIAAASLALPFPIGRNQFFIEYLNECAEISKSITPNCEIGTDNVLQSLVLRGLPETRLKSAKSQHQRAMQAFQCDSLKDMLEFYMECSCEDSKSNVSVVHEELPIRNPYPKIFQPEVGDGTPVLGGLHNGKFVGDMLEVFTEDVRKINYRRMHRFRESGLENDEIAESVNRLLDLKDCYSPRDYLL